MNETNNYSKQNNGNSFAAPPSCSEALQQLRSAAPRIHCLTNAVTMNDVANILLAAGGSAIMAQDPAEVEEITAICHGTLINTGTPDTAKFAACRLAGKRANELKHPVVLDPVGAGASSFRRAQLAQFLQLVHPDLVRCNLEEAVTLIQLAQSSAGAEASSGKVFTPPDVPGPAAAANPVCAHGGVESGITADHFTQLSAAAALARIYRTTALISGSCDAVSDGTRAFLIHGGDARITRITGSGCMLSALCAAFSASGLSGWQAACAAGQVWKSASYQAGRKTDLSSAGIGSFHVFLMDIVQTMDGREEKGGVEIEDYTGSIAPLCSI